LPEKQLLSRDIANRRISNRKMRETLALSLLYPDISTGLPAALG
jgi:hypothetical protein